ncbi:hypothetical protein KR084_004815, partial [Drosophila pseudotakahashii]
NFILALYLKTTFKFVDKCDAPPSEIGGCRGDFSSWTFLDKKCQHFFYGGCGATANLFSSSKECEAACLN